MPLMMTETHHAVGGNWSHLVEVTERVFGRFERGGEYLAYGFRWIGKIVKIRIYIFKQF